MASLRLKLIGLVLGSFAPAVIGAVITERAAEAELLEEAGLHIKAVGKHFDSLLDEYERHALLAVDFAAHDADFDDALARRDQKAVGAFVEQLAAAYPHHEIVAAAKNGEAVALGNAEAGLSSLEPGKSPAFAKVLEGTRVSGLFPLQSGEGFEFGLVDAAPVIVDGAPIGALALVTPIGPDYLEYLKEQLDADLVLSVDGKVVAQTLSHPAPALRTEKEKVVFQEEGPKLFAVESFHPTKLQTHGKFVELTATRDVTPLRALARADLRRHLLILGGAALVILLLALRFARRIALSIEGIAGAARRLKEGEYTTAVVPATQDELQLLAENFNSMVKGLKERDRLKETFGRYVTRQVADHLMQGEQRLGGELVPVTVLFSDIRSFTSISETMPPRELLDFLNEYFSGMVESILEHHGVVDKFIGDAIMAVFGAPVPEAEDPIEAVKAALQMRTRLKLINADFLKRGLPEIRTGIGLHYGQVVAGNMGHSQRMEYTVIGDTVNLASRLEGMTKEFDCDILISEHLYEQVKEQVVCEPLRRIQVKGRAEDVMVYSVEHLVDEAGS